MSKNSLTPQKFLITVAVLFLVGYGVFNSRFLIKGPEVEVFGVDKDTKAIQVDSKDFSIQGKAVHSSFISINNRPILIDEFGNFSEKLLLSSGVSIIDIYAKDKFGKEVRKKIDVVYTGEQATTTNIEQIALRALTSSSTDEEISEETSEEIEDNNMIATSSDTNVIPTQGETQ